MTPRLSLALVALSVALSPTVGCVIVDGGPPPPPPDPYGDIAFSWSFAGITSCDEARVDEIDIVVLQGGEVVFVLEREPCVGGGLILTDFLAGRYEVEIDAFDRRSELLYSGGFTVRVEGGRENDVGLVELESFGPPPPPATGDLAFFWAFRYPADEAIIDCALAGVEEVDVILEGPAGEEVAETFPCGDDGAIFQGLAAGRWTLHLDAFGRYRTNDLHLYGVTVDVDVLAEREIDLGDVVLDRDDGSFADIQVEWGFNATTCAAEGLAEMQLSIARAGLEGPEDVTTVVCADLVELRRTFVPGTYTISLFGRGTADDWFSSATIDLAPDTLAVVPLQLAPDAA
jgi:hypothetical protein